MIKVNAKGIYGYVLQKKQNVTQGKYPILLFCVINLIKRGFQ
jgi:hypothetical protein